MQICGATMRSGAFGALFKLPAGFAAPLHTHTYDMKVVILSGTYIQAPEGKPEFRLGPGSYFLQPGGNYRHTTTCDKAVRLRVLRRKQGTVRSQAGRCGKGTDEVAGEMTFPADGLGPGLRASWSLCETVRADLLAILGAVPPQPLGEAARLRSLERGSAGRSSPQG